MSPARYPLSVFVDGPDTGALVRALAPALPDEEPASCSADFADVEPARWLDAVAGADQLAAVAWQTADGPVELGHVAGTGVRVDLAQAPSRSAALELLAAAPWEVATFPSYADRWSRDHGYRPPGFDGGHGAHGWACAFRGAGHDRLVSRRWPPHGPWTLTAEAGDVSFVQFHDPAADPAAALEQARPGHERMGISDSGGYIQQPPILAEGLPGLYEAASATHKVVVHGRDVAERELLAACQIRRDRRDDPEAPIRRIAYVFMEPAKAEAHLPQLWLRELECWTIVRGEEQRLDTDEPPPGLD